MFFFFANETGRTWRAAQLLRFISQQARPKAAMEAGKKGGGKKYEGKTGVPAARVLVSRRSH